MTPTTLLAPDGGQPTPRSNTADLEANSALVGQITYSPDGSTLYAALNGQNTVVAIDPEHRCGRAHVERRHRPA